ncbi:MAG: hypothetical protein IJ690_04320 [Clostridia bacterium]|nr:hypothetical protein [Clostridia bacterium]
MGTNENVNNINENIKNTKNIENNDNVIDMQATQRIVFLSEFLQQGENDNTKEIKEEINVEKSNLENSTESIAQTEQNSNSEKSTVQQTPIEEINEPNNEDAQFEINKSKIQKIDNNNIENDAQTVQQENVIQEDKPAEKTEQEKIKQHAQDKKDYRLERMLFDRINTMQGKIKESLELIKKFERINAKEENLPNIVTTLHDKLTHEVIKQFRTVGIEFNMKSFLVQSVVSDLLGRFEEGITEFKDCSENLNFVREVQEDFESRVELAPTSKVKNFFARIRGMFKPERKQEKLEELERERQEKKLQEANIHLIKYKFINSELEKYTIKNNIVNSLTRELLKGQGSGLTLSISDFMDKKISPEMKKLGLDSLIPNIEDNLYKAYKEKDEDISKEDFYKISLGELRKNMRMQKYDIARSKISVTVNPAKAAEDKEMAI